MTVFDENCIYILKLLAFIFIGCPAILTVGGLLLYPEITLLKQIYSKIFTNKGGENEKIDL